MILNSEKDLENIHPSIYPKCNLTYDLSNES